MRRVVEKIWNLRLPKYLVENVKKKIFRSNAKPKKRIWLSSTSNVSTSRLGRIERRRSRFPLFTDWIFICTIIRLHLRTKIETNFHSLFSIKKFQFHCVLFTTIFPDSSFSGDEFYTSFTLQNIAICPLPGCCATMDTIYEIKMNSEMTRELVRICFAEI